MKIIKIILILLPLVSLVSCDAMLMMSYTVENRSRGDIKVYLPVYPVNGQVQYLGNSKDTVLILKPREKVTLAVDSKIDFPWATRNIYRRNPGICGVKKLEKDTSIEFGCSKSEWKYRNGTSNLKIK